MSESKLTEEEARVMREKLGEYYGEPVRPVSEYCAAFRTWVTALRDRQECREGEEKQYDKWVDNLSTVLLQVSKSNLLWRLIYCGEKKRTRKCPEHKGSWRGLQGDTHNICLHGCDKTGWLPEDDDPTHNELRKFIRAFRDMPIMLGKEEAEECARAAMAVTASECGPEPFASNPVALETLATIEQIFARRGLMLCRETARLVGEGETRKAAIVRHIGYRASATSFEWVEPYYIVRSVT